MAKKYNSNWDAKRLVVSFNQKQWRQDFAAFVREKKFWSITRVTRSRAISNNPLDRGIKSFEVYDRYGGSKPDDLGYVHVKVCDGKGNKNWVPKQRVIYEQHYGPIPKGHKVIFADGNRFNFDIDNLVLVSSSEELIMNQRNLRYDDQDLTKTGHLIAKVIDKRNKLRK